MAQKVKGFTERYRKVILLSLAGILSFSVLCIFFLIGSVKAGWYGPIPGDQELRNIENPIATEVYTSDSVLLGKYYVQNRLDLENDEVTSNIKNALISTEDERFYKHNGIDYKSLARVAIKTILLRDASSGGGSTITQQLVKNLYPRKEYKHFSLIINKTREMLVAKKIEKLYTKEQILYHYLNTVPFGEQTYGIKAGSLRYFNKTPRQLNIEETAMLVGMLKGPSYYNPRRNYDRALIRRNVIISQMEQSGFLSETVKDSLSNLPINLDYNPMSYYTGLAPYYNAQIKKELDKLLNKTKSFRGKRIDYRTDGLKIYTTIDSKMQLYAEQAVAKQMQSLQKLMNRQWRNVNWRTNPSLNHLLSQHLSGYDKAELSKAREVVLFEWSGEKDTLVTPEEEIINKLKTLHSGFLAMDVKTGKIKAWVGGINYKHFKYDHVTSKRQVGSTFKPFVYLAALEQGYKPEDVFSNDTTTYTEYDDWRPRNADNKYGGMYTLKGALTHSVNTVSAGLIMQTGIRNVTSLAYNAGINSKLPQVPSLALGTAELSLFELVQAYQTIANKGVNVSSQFIERIEDKDGNKIYSSAVNRSKRKLASEKNVETLIEILKNVVDNGTATRLRTNYGFSSEIAGKTGTTQNQADGWFVGFTPDLVAGAWVGASYPQVHIRGLKYGQGARTALPIWAEFFKHVYKDENYAQLKYSSFEIPDSIRAEVQNSRDFIEAPVYKEIKRKSTPIIAANMILSH